MGYLVDWEPEDLAPCKAFLEVADEILPMAIRALLRGCGIAAKKIAGQKSSIGPAGEA